MKQRTTLKDVAAALNVSIGTVERAIHGYDEINPDTKKMVLEKIREMDYRPNRYARSLSVRNVKKVAVIMPYSSFFWHKMREGLEAAAGEAASFGIEAQFICLNRMDGSVVLSYIRDLQAKKADGVILVPAGLGSAAAGMDEYSRQGMNLVLLNDDLPDVRRLFYIGPDNALIGRLAGELTGKFAPRGGKCLIVSGAGPAGALPVECGQRIAGFRQVLEKDYPGIASVPCLYDLYGEDAYGAVLRALKENPDAASLYSADGYLCEAALAVRDSGRKGVAVVGHEMSDEINSLLEDGTVSAAICQEPYLQGYYALKYLAEFLIDKRKPDYDSMYIDFRIYTKFNTYGKGNYLGSLRR